MEGRENSWFYNVSESAPSYPRRARRKKPRDSPPVEKLVHKSSEMTWKYTECQPCIFTKLSEVRYLMAKDCRPADGNTKFDVETLERNIKGQYNSLGVMCH